MLKAGQRLKEQRIIKGLTLEEVAKATKIKVPFLMSIEKGEYERLPSSTYAMGFVRNYAGFLGMKEKEILAIFRREYAFEKVQKVLPEGLSKRQDFPIHRIKLKRSVKIVIFVFLLILAYIIFQYRFAIINPPLNVSKPLEGEVVASQTITVVGKTDPNASVFVNNDPASLDNKGNFKKTITTFVGKTTITVKVVNSFGKETTMERHIEVRTNVQ